MEKTVWGCGGLDLYIGRLDPAVQSSLVTLCKVSSLSGCCLSICCDTLSRKAEHPVYRFSERNAAFSLSMWPISLPLQSQPMSFIFRVRKWWGTGKMTRWAKSLLMDQAWEPELTSAAPLYVIVILSLGDIETKTVNPNSVRNPSQKWMNEWGQEWERKTPDVNLWSLYVQDKSVHCTYIYTCDSPPSDPMRQIVNFYGESESGDFVWSSEGSNSWQYWGILC